jgi:hypothetical protein
MRWWKLLIELSVTGDRETLQRRRELKEDKLKNTCKGLG